MAVKVILDTDIGSDIDDAVALAYLLAQPECELLGITTVTGEAVKRAMMASALCKVAGKRVPIFPGVEKPMIILQRQTKAPQAEALSRWPHDRDFPQGQAIEFLKDTIRANPGEVVLLTIGPLTNIGLLFAEDPEIPALLKSLVLMCGVFGKKTPDGAPDSEWNGILDPHATAIVYNAPAKIHRSIGLDVTRRVKMSADEVRRRFTPDLLRPVLDFAEVWFRDAREITFHDPLAAATIFADGICTFTKGTVDVELASPRLAGTTIWKPGGDAPRHEVALDVNPERFFDHYFSVF
jgi:inosine-uridine nucleoside N-ribohydrolase